MTRPDGYTDEEWQRLTDTADYQRAGNREGRSDNGQTPNDAGDDSKAEPSTRYLRSIAADTITTKALTWLWLGRVVLAGLTLLAGREGLGKSTLAAWLISEVTRGTLPGEHFGKPQNVICVAGEDARDAVVVPRLKAAGADLTRVFFVDAMVPIPNDEALETPIVIPLDADLLAAKVTEHDAVLVVLDPATSTIDEKLDGNKDRQLRVALEAISRRVAQRTECAVLAVVHFGKRTDKDTGRLILGSIAWSQAARGVLACARSEGHEFVLTTTKANYTGDGQSLQVRIDAVPLEHDDGVTVDVSRAEIVGTTDTDARDLLGIDTETRRAGERERHSDVARDWLDDYLLEAEAAADSDTPLPLRSDIVKAEATRAGISVRTLQRAREELGVTIVPAGFPRRSYWRLPADPDAADERAEP